MNVEFKKLVVRLGGTTATAAFLGCQPDMVRKMMDRSRDIAPNTLRKIALGYPGVSLRRLILPETPSKLGSDEAPGMRFWEHQDGFKKFVDDMYIAKGNAVLGFSDTHGLLGVLLEVMGGLAQSLLEIEATGGSPQKVYNAAVQTASVAFRLATTGEPNYGYAGGKCHYHGCLQPAIGGPCSLCYKNP